MDETDKELVNRTLQNDLDAYEQLIRRHQGRIFYLGLKFHKNYEDAEDFTQEVFLKAYENLEGFSNSVPFSAWIYRIGYNHGINRISKKEAESFALTEDTENWLAAPDDTPDKVLEKEEDRNVVGKILRKLPEMYNIVIKMRFFDGLSYKEMAEIIGKPINTVKSHIFRAKELIKKGFERYLRR